MSEIPGPPTELLRDLFICKISEKTEEIYAEKKSTERRREREVYESDPII